MFYDVSFTTTFLTMSCLVITFKFKSRSNYVSVQTQKYCI
jgi:hypothetical protein